MTGNAQAPLAVYLAAVPCADNGRPLRGTPAAPLPGYHDFLMKAAVRYTGQSAALFETVARSPLGKPFFPHAPHLHFSVSHSGAYWACVFASGSVGLDLQRHTPCDPARLSRRFFHPEETAYLQQRDFQAFFRIWTEKESFVKYLGTGFTRDPESFSVLSPPENVTFFHPPFLDDYDLCVCTRDAGPIVLYPL